jgi:hypothetical protein
VSVKPDEAVGVRVTSDQARLKAFNITTLTSGEEARLKAVNITTLRFGEESHRLITPSPNMVLAVLSEDWYHLPTVCNSWY